MNHRSAASAPGVLWRAKGPGVEMKVPEDIAQLPLEIGDADLELTRSAAELRAQHKLLYTDCFAAALAAARKASLATSDKDFAHVENRRFRPCREKLDLLWTT